MTCHKPIDHVHIASQLFDATLRFGQIIWIAAEPYDTPSEPMERLLEDISEADLERLFGPMPTEFAHELIELGDERAMWEHLSEVVSTNRKYGLLICVERPIHTARGPHSSSYSWGSFRQHWIYAESLDQAIDEALAWSEAEREKEIAEATRYAVVEVYQGEYHQGFRSLQEAHAYVQKRLDAMEPAEQYAFRVVQVFDEWDSDSLLANERNT